MTDHDPTWGFSNNQIEDGARNLAVLGERQLRLLSLQVTRAIQIATATPKPVGSAWSRTDFESDAPVWSQGTNIPGYLPDTDEPATPVTWTEGRDAIRADLEHEAQLLDDNPDYPNSEDAEHLIDEASALEAVPFGSEIEVAATDATGQVRVWWLMKAE